MKLKKIVISALDNMAFRLGYHKPRKGYQDSRFPEDQYSLISATKQYAEINNTIEIGCNLGRLAQAISADGKFSVGLDIRDHWFCRDNGKAVLGVYPIDLKSIQSLPEVDAFLLLSVHHQWVKDNGDQFAQELVTEIFRKSRKCMFIEFASIASKYGYANGERFKDNNPDDVKEYAERWLAACGVSSMEYLGQTREKPPLEPNRLLYMLTRKSGV